MAQVIAGASSAKAQPWRSRSLFAGYGALVPDPNGLLDLPRGFQYRVLTRAGDTMTHHGPWPSGCSSSA